MAYGTIVKVRAPIEIYDALHAEIMRSAGDANGSGLIFHMTRETPDGFEITELWESREQADAFNREVVWPAMQRIGAADSGPEPEVVEFDPRVLMVTRQFMSDSATV